MFPPDDTPQKVIDKLKKLFDHPINDDCLMYEAAEAILEGLEDARLLHAFWMRRLEPSDN